jgi:hypothetical protein
MTKENVLVIGGNGTIGTKLVKFLKEKDHEVYVLDPNGIDETNEELQFISSYKFGKELKERNIKSVVHLGEYLCMDDPMSPMYISNNLHEFAHVLRECGKVGIPVTCLSWMNLSSLYQYDNTLYYSLTYKKDIVDIYNRGISCISNIRCPIVIDFDYPASNYCGIFNRILNGFMYGNSIHMDASEFCDGRWRHYIDINTLLNKLYSNLFIRSKLDPIIYDDSMYLPINHIIKVFMDILGIEKMEINCGKKLINLSRGDATTEPKLTKIFESEIDRLNETLHRLNNE